MHAWKGCDFVRFMVHSPFICLFILQGLHRWGENLDIARVAAMSVGILPAAPSRCAPASTPRGVSRRLSDRRSWPRPSSSAPDWCDRCGRKDGSQYHLLISVCMMGFSGCQKTFRLRCVFLCQHLCRHPFFFRNTIMTGGIKMILSTTACHRCINLVQTGKRSNGKTLGQATDRLGLFLQENDTRSAPWSWTMKK